MKTIFKWVLCCPLFFCFSHVFAQHDKLILEKMIQDDSTDINVLAAYPAKVRENIFEVSTHPELIIRLGDLQQKSRVDFMQLVSAYTKEEQGEIWNLMRYDDLISKLVSSGNKSIENVEGILKNYPAEIHDVALKYSEKEYNLLVSIDRTNKIFKQSFEDLVKPLPVKSNAAFNDLLKEPEAISILNKNMHMTVELGDVYKRNPGIVVNAFDSLNLELAREKARDTEAFKEELKNNPEAADEFNKSAKEYAERNGYTENDYRETDPKVIEHYHYYPYPYWCGYPWWYEYNYWYPYPYWYHWGYYYWHGNIVWIGSPSWYFIHWHFHHYSNFYTYPHLTNMYINHYYGPRKTRGSNARVVNNWVRDNEKSLPRDFLRNDAKRTDRIKEYGKFEMDYVNHVVNNPNPIRRSDFMVKHATDYPNLEPVKETLYLKEKVPVKQQPDLKKNVVSPDPVIKSKDVKKYPVRPEKNPDISPGKYNDQQPKPRLQQQQKPKTTPPPLKQQKQQTTPGGKRK